MSFGIGLNLINLAGIYIHIPFCKQACHYCDFHFSTSSKSFADLASAIMGELSIQKSYLDNAIINTVYFGGGTPSLLPIDQIEAIIEVIHKNYSINTNVEWTLEANPDDLSLEKLKQLKQAGINRLSIGVQSFQPEILSFLNRVHSKNEAIQCIKNVKEVGFDNVNVDLIYGIKEDSHLSLSIDLDIIKQLDPKHISAYCLTIEPKTVFGNWYKKGKLKAVSEEYASQQFELTVDRLNSFGFEQYEVSNFAQDQHYSQHNTNYWKGVHYLGVGPSAHSFNGESRQFNVANNAAYLKAINEGKIPFEKEMLSVKTSINERIMTGLRTKWGCDVQSLKCDFGVDVVGENERSINDFVDGKLMVVEEGKLLLTKEGLLLADAIAAELFLA